MTPYSPCSLLAAAAALLLAGCDGRICCGLPALGSLQVTTVTTGANIDPDGYTLWSRPEIQGRDSLTRPIGANETITWDLEPATQAVQLKDLQSNCLLSGERYRLITVLQGDTVATTFNVTCS